MKRLNPLKLIILLSCFILNPPVLWPSGFQQSETINRVYKQINLLSGSADKQIMFGINEIVRVSKTKNIEAIVGKGKQLRVEGVIKINILADSVKLVSTLNETGIRAPLYRGWQTYSIRRRKSGNNNIEIWILSTDKTGAMYGCMDIAEALNNQTIDKLSDSDNKPYLERRGIKFNIPLDLRTPSYSDMSDAFQQNIPVVWDMTFWEKQFDEMARHRYNVISLWSLNPFPSLIKVPEFPDIALNDVWRTTAKLENTYPLNGTGFLNQDLLNNHEVVKKITIREKIDFWRKVMEYAYNRGIEVYFFTWNIFTYGEQGKYGISNSRSNDTTIAYFRASVRELVLTYPRLAGIGITAGENMGGRNEKYTNEQWLWKTYGEGINDALIRQPGRKIRLIHRFHQTGLTEILNEFKGYPGIMDLSIKYSIAHMYSITDPPFGKGAFEIIPEGKRTWLTVRNDDIYSFRWGNPGYARDYILNIPSPERIAGFYMGPDGYCWGKDFLSRKTEAPELVIEKQWYSFMLWGRLSYNPRLPDEIFKNAIASRFAGVQTDTLMKAWSASSMIFPWITRLSWGDIDLKWFPEACVSNPTYKGFYTVRDFLEVDPMQGSNIQNITEWAQDYKLNKTIGLISPAAVADTISKYSRIAAIYLNELRAGRPVANTEFDQTLSDIEAFAAIGNYYSEKIKGACCLALYNFYGLQSDKNEAVDHLTRAKGYWTKYSEIYDTKYKPAIFNRVGYVNIPSLISKTDDDINIARKWKPGDIKGYSRKTSTESPFRK